MKPSEAGEYFDETRGFESSQESDDPRLLAAVQEYLAAVENGRRPNRQEFLARHADIAPDLSVCLQGLAFVNSAMGEINGKPHAAADAASSELMGQPLGDFKLLREIGRGGMGIVYEATQLSLDRRVAVKVLPMAAALDPRHLQRFRNEAQAAAQLHHSNIVPVYAVGSDRSVHYYAMQLIDGQSLAEVISGLRAARDASPAANDRSGTAPASVTYPPSSARPQSPPKRLDRFGMASLTFDGGASMGGDTMRHLPSLHSAKRPQYFRMVARLAVQAAEALFYAHQQGVVHRDIKPANLLLDSHGVLWITDFGLAQMYADNGLTKTGDTLGTFRYMSPEQASGRAVVLDQRTDIYSLGVTIYELLTLERALTGQTREELTYQISSVDPRLPRSIDKKIPIELENIIGKAMAKDAAERYPSARAMAEDLQRFLEDKPVLARPPSIVNKAMKWSRRHKAVTVSAGVILVLASAGSTVSSVLIAREQSRTKDAYMSEQRRATEATEQRKRAMKSFDQAREAVDFLTSMAINELPTDPQFFQVRWRMLETSLAYYQSFTDQQKDDPSLSAQLAAAQQQVQAVLGELAAVDELLRKNFEIRLLGNRSVQDDLRLNSQQVASAKALAQQVGSKPPAARPDSTQLTTEQIRQAVSQDAAERDAAIQKVLTAAQSKRLREISRQVRGAFAFSDADVATELALTPAQKNTIRSACAEFHNQHHHGPRQSNKDNEQADMAAVMQRIREILTPRQLESWALLSGQPYRGYAPPYEFWFAPQFMWRDGPNDRGGPPGRRDGEDDGLGGRDGMDDGPGRRDGGRGGRGRRDGGGDRGDRGSGGPDDGPFGPGNGPPDGQPPGVDRGPGDGPPPRIKLPQ